MSRWYVLRSRESSCLYSETDKRLTLRRRLINYTPQATIVRLLTINAVNAYLTLSVLSLTGGFHDQRLLLPGWIGIATVRASLSPSRSL